MTYRILITGDRDYKDGAKIERVLKRVLRELEVLDGITHVEIVEGEARGADKLGAQAARNLGIPEERIKKYPAEWNRYGNGAGPVRNAQMYREEEPNLVLAFHPDIFGKSKGTKDMAKTANQGGTEVRLYS